MSNFKENTKQILCLLKRIIEWKELDITDDSVYFDECNFIKQISLSITEKIKKGTFVDLIEIKPMISLLSDINNSKPKYFTIMILYKRSGDFYYITNMFVLEDIREMFV